MMWSDHSRRGIAIAVLHGLAVRLAPAPQLGDDGLQRKCLEQELAQEVAARGEALIERARKTRSAFRYDDMLLPMAAPDQVLVRLKVDHTGFATLNNAKFGGQFVGRVANTSAILHFSRQKQASTSAAKTWVPTEGSREPVEEGELAAAAIDQLIQDQLDGQEAKLQILEETKMNEALNGFVDTPAPQAVAEAVARPLVRARTQAQCIQCIYCKHCIHCIQCLHCI